METVANIFLHLLSVASLITSQLVSSLLLTPLVPITVKATQLVLKLICWNFLRPNKAVRTNYEKCNLHICGLQFYLE